ncbi:hypothetical protein OFN60_35780, partial [Escherichia coli]|nr:hypothetical protein [Escherichia coli]
MSEEVARDCVLRAIYEVDAVGSHLLNADVETHIKQAYHKENVVPVALLLAANTSRSVKEAQEILKQEPIVRMAIQTQVKSS